MSLSRVVAVGLLAFCLAPAAFAQSSNLALPREFPPASYTSSQYVDSTGCAFVRAGLSGVVTWVPRVNRDRTQLCGFQPSLESVDAAIAENAAAIANAPVISIDVPIEAPADPIAADAADVGMPMETVASLSVPPRIQVPSPVSPRIIEAPAPISTPISTPVSNPPEVVAPTIPRMTMAQICADMNATGRRYMNAVTGVSIRCSPQTQSVSDGALAQVAASGNSTAMVNLGGQVMTVADLCRISDATGNRYLNAATGIAVRCGPQIQSPSGLTAPLGQRLVAPLIAPTIARVPASPAVITPTIVPVSAQPPVAVSPPPGYEQVWDDGRLNPNRGLPEGNAQDAVAAATTHVSAMNVPQPVAPGHRFVQVGTFADPANAERTAAQLRAMGLPVGFANVTRSGTPMRVVAAGPFADAASLQTALQATRSVGFTDAFTRN